VISEHIPFNFPGNGKGSLEAQNVRTVSSRRRGCVPRNLVTQNKTKGCWITNILNMNTKSGMQLNRRVCVMTPAPKTSFKSDKITPHLSRSSTGSLVAQSPVVRSRYPDHLGPRRSVTCKPCHNPSSHPNIATCFKCPLTAHHLLNPTSLPSHGDKYKHILNHQYISCLSTVNMQAPIQSSRAQSFDEIYGPPENFLEVEVGINR